MEYERQGCLPWMYVLFLVANSPKHSKVVLAIMAAAKHARYVISLVLDTARLTRRYMKSNFVLTPIKKEQSKMENSKINANAS